MNNSHNNSKPSDWVVTHSVSIPRGNVLDLACGNGRHGRFLLELGYRVTFLDRDTAGVDDLCGRSEATIKNYDLEDGSPWPFSGELFEGIVVVNYLFRPLLQELVTSIKPGGVLIYQTFAAGNEKYGRPRNPDFLLNRDELLEVFASQLETVAFTQGFEAAPNRVIQSYCGRKLL